MGSVTSSEIKNHSRENGADLVGIADLEPFRRAGFGSLELLEPCTAAVSLALRLDHAVIERIAHGPTPEYAEHYRTVNAALDRIASGLVEWIARRGYAAKAIPASSIVDEVNLLGSLSHKAIAKMAGIGWQGKSLLIISPEFGPRIRLATVLTDMPLQPDRPLTQRCGTCGECAGACPAGAIRNVRSESYESREAALYFDRCADKTREFKAMPGIGARICGVCVKVCPFGREKKKKRT